MRYLVLSDIHGNLAAFDAVLNDAGACDKIWCLGDVIGYGPQPNECIERLRELPHICVAGNHDWAAIDKLDIAAFNPDALRACLWTRKRLTPANWEFIEQLPERLVEGEFTIVHGSPRYPVWEYITHSYVATENLTCFDTSYCLFGHTHVPVVYACGGPLETCDIFPLSEGDVTPIAADGRLFINPGGVGQPRDGDPRASYMIVDTAAKTMEQRRVSYAVEATQQLMLELGLPARLARRLSIGW